mgnify:CR=1 FL=1
MTSLGAKTTAKDDKTLIIVKITLRSLKKGKDGWYAGVKFSKPLPEGVSFVSGIIQNFKY